MKRIEVTCIKKTGRDNPHEKISHIGGIYKDTYWKIPLEEAIYNIEMGFFSYYVAQGGHGVDIIIATHGNGKYLKTQNDNAEANNLLMLSECSGKYR